VKFFSGKEAKKILNKHNKLRKSSVGRRINFLSKAGVEQEEEKQLCCLREDRRGGKRASNA
jgi:hypothetical protein